MMSGEKSKFNLITTGGWPTWVGNRRKTSPPHCTGGSVFRSALGKRSGKQGLSPEDTQAAMDSSYAARLAGESDIL